MRGDNSQTYQAIRLRAAKALAESPELESKDREELRRRWRLANLVPFLGAAQDRSQLFELLADDRWAIQQASAFEGFRHASRDIEIVGLPAAIQGHNWLLFCQFSQKAFEYSAVAKILAERAVLEALLRFGRPGLVHDVWTQLKDPMEQVRAAAILTTSGLPLIRGDDVGSLPRKDEAQDILELLSDAFDHLRQIDDRATAEKWLESISTVASCLAPRMASSWPRWVRHLGPWPDLRDRAWRSILDGWLQGEEWQEEGFLQVMECLGDKAGAVLVELVSLTSRHLPEIRGVLARNPAHQSVLKLVDFEMILAGEAGSKVGAGQIFAALDILEDEEAKIGGLLRWLRTDRDPVRPRLIIDKLARHLLAHRYETSDRNLVLFFDLASNLLAPAELEEQVELSLRARSRDDGQPTRATAFLHRLVSDGQEPRLRETLFERAERWAALAGRDEMEGLALRGEVLRILAAKSARQFCGKDVLTSVLGRLLPQEEDSIREAVALAVSDPREAEAIAEEIGTTVDSAVVRLRTRLRVIRDRSKLQGLVEPASILAVAREMTAARMADELLALGVLLEVPRDVATLAGRLQAIRDPDRRILAVFELVEHALHFQRQAFRPRQRDFAAAVQPLREVFDLGGSEQLQLGLIPELVDLANTFSPRGAQLVEWQDAWLKVLHLRSTPWSRRIELLERLVFDILRRIHNSGSQREEVQWSRALAAGIDWAAGLCSSLAPSDTARGEWQAHCHELISLLVAAAETSPGWVSLALTHPRAARLTLGPFRQWIGAWPTVSRVTAELGAVVDGFASRGTPWSGSKGQFFEALEISEGPRRFAANLPIAAQRTELVDALLAKVDDPIEESLKEAVLPLLRCDPDRLRLFFRRLDDNEQRSLALRMARSRWLPAASAEVVEGVLEAFGEDAAARVWRGAFNPSTLTEDQWLRDLTERAGLGDFDPRNPANLPIVRRLRQVDRNLALPILAAAVPRAMVSGGESAGSAAFGFWLRVYLGAASGIGNRAAKRELLEPLLRGLDLTLFEPEHVGGAER